MEYIYKEWDQDLANQLLAEKGLMDLFNYIMLRVAGDVEKALEIMADLQARGQLGNQYDLDKFKKKLLEKRLIKQDRSGRSSLASKGENWMRQEALEYIFSSLMDGGPGNHAIEQPGSGAGDVLPERRQYEFGDNPADIDFMESYKNAIRRAGLNTSMREEDLTVYEREKTTSAATVLLLDLSHSMILYGEDRITPAKQVAMALAQMIKTRYPKDTLEIVTFGDEAKRIPLSKLPYVSVGPFHTNTQEGLKMGREILLRTKSTNKQIFMITDGKPSVVRQRNGELYMNSFGLDPYIVNRTLDEAIICRKKGIVITTFMIASDHHLKQFIKRLTDLNKGRAYFSPVNQLGNFIFQDFMQNRKKKK